MKVWGLLRWIAFVTAGAVFAWMALTIRNAIGGAEVFTPQSSLASYSIQDLLDFGTMLERDDLGGIYRRVLVVADSVFIAAYLLWVVLALRQRLVLGLALALGYLVADLGENLQLIQALNWTWGLARLDGWMLYPDTEEGAKALVSWFTQAKLIGFVALTAGVLIRDVIRWRRA